MPRGRSSPVKERVRKPTARQADSPRFLPDDVRDWLNERPGWYTSREIWVGMGGDEITFHHLRRRVQTLVERGQVLRRVKHKSFNKAAATGYKWSYSGPVYEYRRKVDVDDLAE